LTGHTVDRRGRQAQLVVQITHARNAAPVDARRLLDADAGHVQALAAHQALRGHHVHALAGANKGHLKMVFQVYTKSVCIIVFFDFFDNQLIQYLLNLSKIHIRPAYAGADLISARHLRQDIFYSIYYFYFTITDARLFNNHCKIIQHVNTWNDFPTPSPP